MLRSTAVLLTRLITGMNPAWVGCEPDHPGLRVYFANHGSHLDFAALWAALPHAVRERTRPVAARDYWGRTRLTRTVIEIFNGLLIAREGISRRDNPIEQMAAAMHEGHSLILFPEGTRFTPAKHAQQQSPLPALLKPKSGGMAYALDAMGQGLHAILDVTLHYPNGIPGMADLIADRIKQVHVDVRLRPIPDAMRAGDYENDRAFRAQFQQWMNGLWQDKQQILDGFSKL